MTTKKKLGRPSDTTSHETRERILAAARGCFSRLGYSKTTNNDIAEASGITTGAIYHYFDSKQALFGAVTAEVTRVIFDAFERVVATETTFADKLRVLLDAASDLHAKDSSFALFAASYPIEIQRHPELGEVLDTADMERALGFFDDLARHAADSGELLPGLDVTDVANMLRAITMGLAYLGALEPSGERHRGAVVAVERVFSAAFDTRVR